jgi:hypothetical protein
MGKDCFYRSFNAGLRWSGIPDDISIIQDETTFEYAEKVAIKYGLTYIDSGTQNLGNNPLIAINRLENGNYHATFLSDNQLTFDMILSAGIIGWPELRKRRFKWITRNLFGRLRKIFLLNTKATKNEQIH